MLIDHPDESIKDTRETTKAAKTINKIPKSAQVPDRN